MTAFAYTLAPDPVQMGVVVLQTDETLESDLRRLLPDAINWLVSRVPAATDVSADSLQAIEHHLTGAASLFPTGAQMAAVGYGCTSGTAQVGADVISARVRAGVTTLAVTEPVSALIAACHALGIQRLALLSPYVATVSDRLRDVLAEAGIATPVFGSFHEANEAQVVRIAQSSVAQAAETLVAGADVQGVFLSCTNLHTLDVIAPLQARLGMPVLSSNLVLAWHMMQLGAPHEAPAHPIGLLE